MFGIMHAANTQTAATLPARRHHRLHYCGTCKTIGNQYGQRARVLLNFDTVFLAELLTHLSETSVETWSPSLQKPAKCFTTPKSNETLPFALRYAAATNVVMASLKVQDNLEDNRLTWFWRGVQRVASPSFRKAIAQFEAWGIARTSFDAVSTQQRTIEQAARRDFENLETMLVHYAQPTADITALLFARAADLLEKPELADILGVLGRQFGALMYVLDAFEDIEKDAYRGQFNPLLLFFGESQTLTDSQLDQARTILINWQEEIIENAYQLPIADAWKAVYADRLTANVAKRLYQSRIVPQTLSQRWAQAKTIATQWTCEGAEQRFNPLTQLKYHTVALAVFAIPRTTEHLNIDAHGSQQILGWWGVLTAVLAGIGLGSVGIKSLTTPPVERKRKAWWKRLFAFKFRYRCDPNAANDAMECGTDCISSFVLALLVLFAIVVILAIIF